MAEPHQSSGDQEHEHEQHHQHQHEPIDYRTAVLQYRSAKDAFLKTHQASPIPAADREAFSGLPYYPVDPSLRFDDLVLQPYGGSEPTRFAIPTSDGRLRDAVRAGVFRFQIGGAERTLTAYTFAEGERESLFMPFLDGTSGTETYGAGRYMDLYPEDDETYSLDFNFAYHPSCVYDARFSCPLTPAENRLAVRIEAGERLPDTLG